MPPSGGTRAPVQPYQIRVVSGQGGAGFQDQFFGPGIPVNPSNGRQPTRHFDFAVGSNLQYTPRAYEAFGFAQLRAFSNVELVRLAIETRKDQVERLDWTIKVKGHRRGGKPDAKPDPRVEEVSKFLRKPDGFTPFHVWLRLILEDLLAIDAPAFERRRLFNGELAGVDIVPGDTVKLLVDGTGRTPRPPLPAYQQIIKGQVWADLTADDLFYMPRNRRPNHFYGFSPVEQIIVTITTAMRRQTRQVAHFTDGNVPAGILNAPEGWTPDQIKDWQDWFDAKLRGQDAARSSLLWTPTGTKYQAFSEPPIKDEFDEWLARIVCFAFSLPPTPFVKMLNRATAEESGERALEEGLEPILLWCKRMFDTIIQDDLGHADLEFAWERPKQIDPAKQATIHDAYLKNGAMKLNEVRDDLGMEPVEGGDANRIYTNVGALAINGDDHILAPRPEPVQTPDDPDIDPIKPAPKPTRSAVKPRGKKETGK